MIYLIPLSSLAQMITIFNVNSNRNSLFVGILQEFWEGTIMEA